MKSNELLALKDLSAYRVMTCYWAQLSHGLMGTFPALIAKTKDMFVCADKQTLGKILETMPKRRFAIMPSLMIVNEADRLAFDIHALHNCHDMGKESESLPVILADDLQTMTSAQHGNSPLFKWAPGLIGDDMSPAEFAETLQTALKQARD